MKVELICEREANVDMMIIDLKVKGSTRYRLSCRGYYIRCTTDIRNISLSLTNPVVPWPQ